MTRTMWWKGGGVILPLLPFLIWCWPLRHIETGHAGLVWKPFGGELSLLSPGWHVEGPLTLVTDVDTRPQRLCLSSSAHAAPNCRLVQFDISQYGSFVETEGWRYYWWSNRFSFNEGYSETYRGFRDVLRGYAFSEHPYPFVRILEQ